MSGNVVLSFGEEDIVSSPDWIAKAFEPIAVAIDKVNIVALKIAHAPEFSRLTWNPHGFVAYLTGYMRI